MTLACPACNEPLVYTKGSSAFIQCSNENCISQNSHYPIVNETPVLICPNLEYTIFDTLEQFNNPTNTITGFQGRDLGRRRLRYRQKIQDLFYNFSKLELSNYKRLLQMLEANARVLIVGGGNIDTSQSSFVKWVQLFREKNINFTVTDIYLSENVHFVCDAHYLPFLNSSFDAVIITTVLEHVLSPPVVVSEIYRVLEDNGLIYATVPFTQCVHEGAYDFTRFTLSGQRWLLRYFIEHDAGCFVGTCCAYLYNFTNFISLMLKCKQLGIIVRLFFWRLFTLLDNVLPNSVHINQGMCNYFLGAKSKVQSIKACDMPDYYNKSLCK